MRGGDRDVAVVAGARKEAEREHELGAELGKVEVDLGVGHRGKVGTGNRARRR